jgi:hypothetical protein
MEEDLMRTIRLFTLVIGAALISAASWSTSASPPNCDEYYDWKCADQCGTQGEQNLDCRDFLRAIWDMPTHCFGCATSCEFTDESMCWLTDDSMLECEGSEESCDPGIKQ